MPKIMSEDVFQTTYFSGVFFPSKLQLLTLYYNINSTTVGYFIMVNSLYFETSIYYITSLLFQFSIRINSIKYSSLRTTIR